MTCHRHPFGSDSGADCTNEAPLPHAHTYVATWAPDRHDEGADEQEDR